MSIVITSSLPRTAAGSAVARTVAVLRQSFERLQDRIRARRAAEHLSEMPDYILRDIGISRSEVMSVVLFGGRDVTRRSR
jgi:uncharacterized protein YjiS (DUF1127 family)